MKLLTSIIPPLMGIACALIPISTPLMASSEVMLPELAVALRVFMTQEDNVRIPRFEVTITNLQDEMITVLDVRDSEELQDMFCRIYVKSLDDEINFPEFLTGFGDITESDYVALAPEDSMTIEMGRLPINYSAFVPGTYEAYVVFVNTPFEKPAIYRSKPVRFEIK